jgi:ferritin-like metal-binding protein YciE
MYSRRNIMPLDTLENTLIHELSDLLSAEKQFAKALQTVAKNADGDALRQMAQEHQAETVQQAERLMQAFAALGSKPERGVVCDAAKGLVEEANGTLKEDKPKGLIKDVVLMGSCLRIEHYEIAGYSAAIAIARSLGKKEVVAILQTTLKEEQGTAKKLQDASAQLLKSGTTAPTPAPASAAKAPAKAAAPKSTSAKAASANKAPSKPAATKSNGGSRSTKK